MFPKLTTRLKVSILGDKPIDSTSENFHRQSILSMITQDKANKLTFSSSMFVGDGFSSQEIAQTREDYSIYLTIINTLTNGSSQQNEAAKVIYNIISKSQSEEKAYQDTVSYAGSIPASLFTQLYAKVQALRESANKVLLSTSSKLLSTEYGSNISFTSFHINSESYFPYPLIISELSLVHESNHETREIVLSSLSSSSIDSSSKWLLDLCQQFCNSHESVFHRDQLAEEVVKLVTKLMSTMTSDISLSDALQSRLFELVGEDGFEFMAMILQNLSIAKTISLVTLKDTIKTLDNSKSSSQSLAMSSTRNNQQRPRESRSNVSNYHSISHTSSHSSGRNDTNNNGYDVNSMTQSDLLSSLGFTGEYLEQERSLGLHGGRPHVGATDVKTTLAVYGGGLEYHEKRGLPLGSTRVVKQGYEEVFMPAPEKPISKDANNLIPIDSLEDWAQLAFQGTKYLNRIQSTVFDTAYNSSENMLICAPTGAGKTNIAMLTFLQLVKQNIIGGQLDKESIKAVYIAPMKALAQEVVAKFSERLGPLGLVVKEYTGDMQLTKAEVSESQLLVSTPEKYDVITRKGGDGSLGTLVSLIIIDEVHLLADDRGAVIETIVARTQRYVESSQKLVRLIGLSATLPNYKDVAMFLGVNQRTGLYFFGPEYRPVPLAQTFIGVTEKQKLKRNEVMNRLAYEKAISALEKDKQVMIFVHSRKETSKTAEALIEIASRMNTLTLFSNIHHEKYGLFKRDVDKSRTKEVQQLFYRGIGVHHAGMLRSDRTLTETLFEQGLIRILCCTATLAWGVNLPAHTVIIKGTELYDPERGGFVDLSILDIFQIFGRAGRPQYDNTGDAILITPHASLGKYLSLLGEQSPIESGFIKSLADHMNAEIVNGTINNIKEAIQWLSYTFLYIRMCKNPMAYGISIEERMEDARLEMKRLTLIRQAAQKLDQCRMIRYDQRSGNLAVTDLGRIASHYYIKHDTIESFNAMLFPHLNESDAMRVLCSSAEFNQLKVRPEELPEIDSLRQDTMITIKGGSDETAGKVNILLQSYLNNRSIQSFTLQSDTNYVATNAGRISRALFEISLKRGWSSMTYHYLSLSKAIDRRMNMHQHPLRQFMNSNDLSIDIIRKLEDLELSIDRILDMSGREIGEMIHNLKIGPKILSLAKKIPKVDVEATIQPLTRGILRININIYAKFDWSDRYHGIAEPFWIWIEDGENEYIYHSESFSITKKQLFESKPIDLEFVIPVKEPLPPQYYIRIVSDRWMGSQITYPLSFKHILMPDRMPPHTNLLDIHPVPISALQDKNFEGLYVSKFSHFNPIQSQVFHVLYHSDVNALIGAPTGSGKTIIGEFAILRLFKTRPGAKAIYIAPLKALSRERLFDWQRKLGKDGLGYYIEELTGDITPDIESLHRADLLIVTPEKWDSISRGWQKREYVQLVELVIIDEIHLLGVDRGPVLEVIVSRMRFISNQTKHPIRFIGLSTALANPRDLADWLGIENIGLYNFRPSVRPIPMTIHIMGFPGKHYCPRMATMNKPCYAAILEHSPKKPVLIFVSSRRQTRLTALDIISYCASDDNSKLFLNMPEDEISMIAETLKDNALRDTIVFGVGIHHAGLNNHDRSTVEQLFSEAKIQVLVCTSTLAWGVNLPCHLVIVKGTEFYDGKTKRYVDMPVTDVLQMMGRAGRPQFDTTGVSCIFVHEPKKNFYRKFLHEPFPVESSLFKQLHPHINAEIASGTLKNIKDCIEYISWTYFFRRLIMNPSYYKLYHPTSEGLESYLVGLIQGVLSDLRTSGCIELVEGEKEGDEGYEGGDNLTYQCTMLGRITSYYYLDYRSSAMFQLEFKKYASQFSLSSLITDKDYISQISFFTQLLCKAMEFSELPIRHNEDIVNAKLSESLPWPVDDETSYDEAYTKAYLLLQAHIYQKPLPISDYVNDTKSVLDQVPRVLNAMIDIAADLGYLHIVVVLTKLSQMLIQGLEYDTSLSSLQQFTLYSYSSFDNHRVSGVDKYVTIKNISDLRKLSLSELNNFMQQFETIPREVREEIIDRIRNLPHYDINYHLSTLTVSDKTEYQVNVAITTIDSIKDSDHSHSRSHSRNKSEATIYSPRYPKSKTLSYWLVIGYGDELLALKRIGSLGSSLMTTIDFDRPEERLLHPIKLYLLNDSIFTLDYELIMDIM